MLKQQEFIDKSNRIHNFKYDYSKSKYIGSAKKIFIICPSHGVFEQLANSHMLGFGCKKCSNEKSKIKLTKTTENFIKEANAIHNFKYDYSKSKYIHSHESIVIICAIHGEFNQTATDHLSKSGCPKCKGIHIGNIKRKSQNNIIIEMNDVHNFKYDYSKVKYKNANKNIEILCKKHGSFFQTPTMHLSGQGCPICGRLQGNITRTYTNTEFIEAASKIHNNKYNYLKTKYIGIYLSVVIICFKHGEFTQKPVHHLQGMGCKKCINQVSKQETKWLDSLNINLQDRQVHIIINNKKYYLDAYDSLTNTIYEFYGDFWHGNPKNKKFPPEAINKKNKKSFGELYNKTINREKELKNAGYNLITMWEYNWKLLSI